MNLLKLLLNVSKNSVYGLVNESKKEVYLTYSTDSLSSIVRLINDNRNNPDLDQIEYKLFEEVTDKKQLKLRFNYWYDQLKEEGYKFINKRRPVVYKITYNIEKKLLVVKLKSKYSQIVIGVFDDILDTKSFIHNYGNPYYIKFSDNRLTKEYLNGKHDGNYRV